MSVGTPGRRSATWARLALALGAVLLASACTASNDAAEPAAEPAADAAADPVGEEPAQRQAPPDDGATPTPTPPDGETVGGDGSAIVLEPLTADDIDDAALAGELACSFSTAADASPLLFARGNVASDDPSRGMVSVAGYVEPVAAPGGFDAMLRGTRFSGAGKVITVELTGPAIGGGESPPTPATLTYQRTDGAERTIAGQWQCGP